MSERPLEIRSAEATAPGPLVSVILPTHNRSALLRRSVGSVLGQTYRNLELIVIDDGSTEDIESLLRSFQDPRIIYLRREIKGGAAAARNYGIATARGELLAFQDSDDEWLLEKLAIQIASLESAGPEISLCVCTVIRILQSQGVRLYPSPGMDLASGDAFRNIFTQPIAYTQSWLLRRSAFQEVGKFDEAMTIWSDLDYLLRIARQHRICVVSAPLAISTQIGDSLTSVHSDKWVSALAHIKQKHTDWLAANPKTQAKLHHLGCTLHLSRGQVRAARHELVQSLRVDPLNIKALVLWCLTWTSLRVINKAQQIFNVIKQL